MNALKLTIHPNCIHLLILLKLPYLKPLVKSLNHVAFVHNVHFKPFHINNCFLSCFSNGLILLFRYIPLHLVSGGKKSLSPINSCPVKMLIKLLQNLFSVYTSSIYASVLII